MKVGPLSLGALFIGLGFGWLAFDSIGVTGITVALLLMSIGLVVIASALVSWRLHLNAVSIVTAFSVGLVISLILVSGIPTFSGPGPVVGERTFRFDGEAITDNLSFEFSDVNGVIRVTTWNRNSYNISMIAKARGWSDGENVMTLEQVSAIVNRQVEGGKLNLVLVLSVPSWAWRKLDVSINASLPAGPITDLKLSTTNGDIFVSGIKGGDIDAESTNGGIHLENTDASRIICATTNGVIQGSVEAGELRASSVNGRLDFRIPGRMSGNYSLTLVNGNIDIVVKDYPENGFSADLSTVNGGVNVDLPNFTYTTDNAKRKVGVTAGFDSRPVKIKIKAETVNGNLKVSTDAMNQ